MTTDQFWATVDRRGEHECWLWLGRLSRGYGYLEFDGREWRAHVLAYELTYGPRTADKPCVLHRCDQPQCVNPGHLFAGTQAENMADMVSKGRQRAPFGERNGSARLTAVQVREMRYLFSQGTHTKSGLAQRYGVSRKLVYDILKGSRWVGVEP